MDEYWQLVRYEIQKLPKKAQHGRPITHVVSTGESALDEAFLDVVRDALSDVLHLSFTETSVTHMVSPLFATARGAAELAKRESESPVGCVETAICRWWREAGWMSLLVPALERFAYQLNSPVGLDLKLAKWYPGGDLKLGPPGAHFKQISGVRSGRASEALGPAP